MAAPSHGTARRTTGQVRHGASHDFHFSREYLERIGARETQNRQRGNRISGVAIFSGTSSAVRKDLLSQFYDKGLAQEFVTADNKHLAEKDPKGNPIPPEQAHLEALVDVITAHREDFNPDEFTFSASLTGGGSGTVTIQSAAAMSADIFKRQVDAKQADYDAVQTAKVQKPDPAATKLDALNQALQNLLPNGDAPPDGDVTDAKTAYAVLTKKLYPDDKDHPDDTGQSTDPTQQPGPTAQAGDASQQGG